MPSVNGIKYILFSAIVLLLSLNSFQGLQCQEGILDSIFTFKEGNVRTGNALNMITRETGYHFTFDSRLIDTEARTELNFRNERLKVILDSILGNKSLIYSVIDRFIIISRAIPTVAVSVTDTLSGQVISNITGIVIDDESSEPLPYAAVSLKHSGRGTVTNNNGEFGIKLLPGDRSDTLNISYLGYIAREIPVGQSLGNNFRIGMTREFISIPEIIIKNQIPQEIIHKTLSGITDNYGNTPSSMTAFYREGVLRKNQLQTYSEAVLQIFKSPYSATLLKDQIKVLKSRKIEKYNVNDSVTVRLKAGLSTCLELDGIRNAFDFLTRGISIEEYSYRLTDIISYDDESAYEIEFGPKEGAEIPMFRGSLFINTSDYGLLKADFEINSEYLQKMKGTFVSNPTRTFTTWPVAVRYSVSYRRIDGRYFLNHVRGDLEFQSKQKKRLFNALFNVFFEMAITSSRTENVTRFDREELAPVHEIFSKTIKEYDPIFWENQDFLKPEENLLQALKNMKVRLQEFSE